MLARLKTAIRPTLVVAGLCLAVYGAWNAVRWTLGGVLGEAARAVGAPAYEALAIVDRDRTDLLVRNALDRDPAVATPARVAINTLIDRWTVEARSDEHGEFLRDRLLSVQREVHVGLDGLTPSGVRWAEQLGAHMIRVAERLPLADRVAVIDGASELLDKVASTTLQSDAVEPSLLSPDTPNPAAEPDLPGPEPRWYTIPEALRGGLAAEPAPVAAPEEPKPIAPQPPSWQPDWQVAEPLAEVHSQPADAEPTPVADANDRTTVRGLIAELIELQHKRGQTDALHREPAAQGPASRTETPEPDPRLLVVQQALRELGYSTLRADHARLFVSDRVADRRRLAERLAAEGVGDSLKLALELARDDDATVRLAALRTLSASPYRAIVREAFRMAVADPDPRVASLSGELRARL